MDAFFFEQDRKFLMKFYKNILRDDRFDPEHVMISNDLVRGMLSAMKAGIKYGVNIDRRQKESIVHRDGGISVNSLEVLTGMMIWGE